MTENFRKQTKAKISIRPGVMAVLLFALVSSCGLEVKQTEKVDASQHKNNIMVSGMQAASASFVQLNTPAGKPSCCIKIPPRYGLNISRMQKTNKQ